MKVNKDKNKKVKKNNNKVKKGKGEANSLSAMSIDSFMETINTQSESPSDTDADADGDYFKNIDTDDDNDSGTELDPIAHKKSLEHLKKSDPEFYAYLKDNDKKLLDFNLSDSELDSNDEETNTTTADDDDDDEDKVAEKYKRLHILPSAEELKGASDESDYEDEDKKGQNVDTRKITLKMLEKWRKDLESDKTNKTIGCVIKAFHAALLRVSSDEERAASHSEYTVDGSAVFNGVIQICVLDLQPAIKRFLKIQPDSKQPPHKYKKFPKIKGLLKSYLADFVKLLGGVTSTNILNVLLKHLHHMSPLVVSFNTITLKLIKRLIKLWGTKDDTVRVIAFLCILRITNNQRATYLDIVLKKMYMTYVMNAKFVSPTTLASINFMRRSLVEMFALDLNHTYQHVFLYIRQLAIHLRNAITLKRKEHIQTVYNWQYINSIHLWADLLAMTSHKPQLQQLIYPLVQICVGTLKLIPTAQYFPLRFHCIEILINLSRDSGIYVPILPFIYEILTIYDFSKKHKKVSMKPIQFTCILRLSKSQLSENGFKDAVIDAVYNALLQYAATQAHSIAFNDLVLPLIVQLRKFLKICPIANYCKKIRQILEKIEENSKFIEKERKNFTHSISDQKQIQAWETKVRLEGTPLWKFYENWEKINSIQKKKKVTKNDEIGEYNLPVLKKAKKRTAAREDDGPVELFPSDSEADDDNIPNLGPKPTKRGKRAGKKFKKTVTTTLNGLENGHDDDDDRKDDSQDIVVDADLADW